MGYSTNYTGRITISPPLAWVEFKDSPFHPDRAWDAGSELKFEVVEETVDTDEGQLTRRQATAVVPLTDDSYKGYDIVEHLQRIVDAFPGREFGGYIRADGEETGDIWQLSVVDGRAVQIRPRITWPDGTEEPTR
jgi:hypothetical protein